MTLTFERLSIGYATSLIEGFDAGVETSRLLVRGANGVGKSTLLLTIAGLLRPLVGEVLHYGIPTRSMVDRIGIVSDAIPIPRDLTLSALGRLTTRSFGKPPRLWRSWLDRFGVREGPGTTLGALSEGTCKKALLAVAMVKSPDLLLLDEVANGLDADAAGVVSELLDGFAGTVVYATHGEPGAGGPWTVLEIANRGISVR